MADPGRGRPGSVRPNPPLLERVAALESLLVRTPTVPLADEATGCTLWVKLEYLQPSGSTKDRLAVFVLADAVRTGRVHEGSLIVEASSGSTSIAFAMACARLGLGFRAVMPEGVSGERLLIIRRYGGEVVLTGRADGVAGAVRATEAMAAADPDVHLPRQFANPANVEAHARTTGPELLADVGRPLDGFVAGVGTAGTLMGVARAIRAAESGAGPGHACRIAAVRPTTGTCFAGQPEVCAGFSTGIPGVVEGMSTLLDPAAVGLEADLDVADDAALGAARELCGHGFPVGISSGLNLAGARLLAASLGPGHHVGTVLCDRMERYFSAGLFDDLSAPAR
ncbi:MAG TPA: cysteine synthase family protein [Acidimicrobiales bacterium]|nr:cysteine synthase family protein [Acidimicrobiales bacterium]